MSWKTTPVHFNPLFALRLKCTNAPVSLCVCVCVQEREREGEQPAKWSVLALNARLIWVFVCLAFFGLMVWKQTEGEQYTALSTPNHLAETRIKTQIKEETSNSMKIRATCPAELLCWQPFTKQVAINATCGLVSSALLDIYAAKTAAGSRSHKAA